MPSFSLLSWAGGSFASNAGPQSSTFAGVVIFSGCFFAALQVGSTRTAEMGAVRFVLNIAWFGSFSCLDATIALWSWLGSNLQRILSACLAAFSWSMPMPHGVKERLIRASLAGLCLAGVLWIRSNSMSEPMSCSMHSIGSFLMISCGIFFLQALSPEKGTSSDSINPGLPLDASLNFNSNEEFEAKKFMKSTVASRMRCQGSGIGSCGNAGTPRLKESTKLKDLTNFRQNDFSRSEKAGNFSKTLQHQRREGKETGNLNNFGPRAPSGPRLLECLRAGGRLLRDRVSPRIACIRPVEVPVPCKRIGDTPEPQKAKSLEDAVPATTTNHLKLVNQKQKMPEKKVTSQLQKASSNSSTNCQSEGDVRFGRVRDATKPGSLDRDVATVQSFKNLESGPKTSWRSVRRGHSPRQYLMQKENICPAGTARVDKEAKKLQQLNYLRRLPCARNQPLQVASTKHSYDGYDGGIFIDPEFQDSPSEAFLEIVRMCERCETGHLEAWPWQLLEVYKDPHLNSKATMKAGCSVGEFFKGEMGAEIKSLLHGCEWQLQTRWFKCAAVFQRRQQVTMASLWTGRAGKETGAHFQFIHRVHATDRLGTEIS
eukprot:symbB.v1.2.032215.t3/scaffold3835.1/size49521/6